MRIEHSDTKSWNQKAGNYIDKRVSPLGFPFKHPKWSAFLSLIIASNYISPPGMSHDQHGPQKPATLEKHGDRYGSAGMPSDEHLKQFTVGHDIKLN